MSSKGSADLRRANSWPSNSPEHTTVADAKADIARAQADTMNCTADFTHQSSSRRASFLPAGPRPPIETTHFAAGKWTKDIPAGPNRTDTITAQQCGSTILQGN